MKPILYSYFRSSASQRVRIALNLKNIAYEYQAVHLLKDGGQQNALNFLAVNPMGQVPVFVDGMNVISQSMAIVTYIDDKWEDKIKLFPEDIAKKAAVIEFCEIINSGMHPPINLMVRQKIATEFKATEGDVKNWTQSFMIKGFEVLNKFLAKSAGQCCFGDELTAADAFLYPAIVSAATVGLKLDNYPNVKKVTDKLATLDAFKKSHPMNQPDSPQEN